MFNKISAIFILITAFTVTTYSQGIMIGFGGGFTKVQNPANYVESTGFSEEFHVGVKAKLSIPLVPITPTGFIQYHIFNGTTNSVLGDVESTQNVFSLGFGGELSLIPGPISPYFALEFAYNNFGELEMKGPLGTVTSEASSRAGINAGVGAEFTLLPAMDIDFSAKYNFMNLIGKSDGEETISAITLNLTFLFSAL